WYSVRNGFLKPRSFGRRMCSGIWPPSNPAETWLRALVPLVPRPAVLPLDASPRPTRVLAVLAPGAGRRWCTLRMPPAPSVCFAGLLDGVREVPDDVVALAAGLDADASVAVSLAALFLGAA